MVSIKMAITIKLKNGLNAREEQWLAKNIGPRLHYIHNSIGGQGWIAKQHFEEFIVESTDGKVHSPQCCKVWNLTLEDERYASFFLIKFPQ